MPPSVATVSGSNKGGFSKAVLAAAQAVPQPVVNTGTALSAQSVSYAIEGNDIGKSTRVGDSRCRSLTAITLGYLANFSFGTPLKDFLMLVDTGR